MKDLMSFFFPPLSRSGMVCMCCTVSKPAQPSPAQPSPSPAYLYLYPYLYLYLYLGRYLPRKRRMRRRRRRRRNKLPARCLSAFPYLPTLCTTPYILRLTSIYLFV